MWGLVRGLAISHRKRFCGGRRKLGNGLAHTGYLLPVPRPPAARPWPRPSCPTVATTPRDTLQDVALTVTTYAVTRYRMHRASAHGGLWNRLAGRAARALSGNAWPPIGTCRNLLAPVSTCPALSEPVRTRQRAGIPGHLPRYPALPCVLPCACPCPALPYLSSSTSTTSPQANS